MREDKREIMAISELYIFARIQIIKEPPSSKFIYLAKKGEREGDLMQS